MDAALEVAVARQDRDDRERLLLDLVRHRCVERPRVADAGGAAVAGQREPQLGERLRQPGPIQVGGDGARAGGERRLDDRVDTQAARDGLPGKQPCAHHDARVGRVRARRDRRDHDGAVADLARPGGGRPTGGQDAREGRLEAGPGLRHRDPVLGSAWPGEARLDRRQVQVDRQVEVRTQTREAPHPLGPCIAFHELDASRVAPGQAQVGERLVVDREDRRRCPELGAHVADRGAIRERQAGQPVAGELHERADHAKRPQALGDGQHQVGGGGSRAHRAVQPDPDHPRHGEVEGLAEEHRLGLDPADPVAQDAEGVDHGRVGIGPHERVREGEGPSAVVRDGHHGGQVLEVDLVHDACAGWHDPQPPEGPLGPAQELVALAVPLVFARDVEGERVRRPKPVDLDGVVDHEVSRHERVDPARVAPERRHRVPHGGQVDDRRHAGEVLQDDAGREEGNLRVAARPRPPAGDPREILLRHEAAPGVPQDVLQEDLQRDGGAIEVDLGRQRGDGHEVRKARPEAGSGADRLARRHGFLVCSLARRGDLRGRYAVGAKSTPPRRGPASAAPDQGAHRASLERCRAASSR